MGELVDKVTLITGASTGIGRAIAILFARNGSKLSLAARNVSGLEETRKICAEFTKEILLIQTDVSKEQDCQAAIQKTVDHFKKLDILVNNAGIGTRDTIDTVATNKLPTQKTEEHFAAYDTVMDVNLKGPIMLCHYAAPHLIAAKGTIVNISSLLGIRAVPGIMTYSISKAALDHFTKILALELAPKGVRVNSVNPGLVPTDFRINMGASQEMEQQILARSVALEPLGRLLSAEEVAEATLFLASSRGSYCNGLILALDGGKTNGIAHGGPPPSASAK